MVMDKWALVGDTYCVWILMEIQLEGQHTWKVFHVEGGIEAKFKFLLNSLVVVV